MGSFAGHVLPGSFFVLYGAAWIILAILTHLKSRASSSQGKRVKRDQFLVSSVSFSEYKRDQELSRKSWLPFPCPTISRVPIEPILKILFSFSGILVEAFLIVIKDHDGKAHIVGSVYHIFQNDGYLSNLDKLQHITMYGAFMLSGIVDILCILLKFPHQTGAIFLTLAFSIEGILFYFHTEGRDVINIQIHFILTVVIGICALFAFLRVLHSTNLFINVGLGFSIFLQGSWFIQAAYFLFPPGGKGVIMNEIKRHKSEDYHIFEHNAAIMFIACTLSWHVMFIMIGVLALWVMCLFAMRNSSGRRLMKRNPLRLNPPKKWEDLAENEKLIDNETFDAIVKDREENKDLPIAVEMKQLSDIETATL